MYIFKMPSLIRHISIKNFSAQVLTRLELVTLCVLSRCDNHYTTEPHKVYLSFVIILVLGVLICWSYNNAKKE